MKVLSTTIWKRYSAVLLREGGGHCWSSFFVILSEVEEDKKERLSVDRRSTFPKKGRGARPKIKITLLNFVKNLPKIARQY